ncbi:hypothetical protein [Zavarzinia compransoris]|uniref:Uncharacterized protein n=1 Tax=Zavarzinia compransoris TaxID=1264899 RepID=A0A317DZD9_9PROT|nr:hypothetical protein [Zavarzinia compransoris]PWR19584.1 hypothetical protein DKG75_14010 [Zavarzinia compransoris]TDP40432.1 hypothetical protein DES42_11453 [Zavarzinia compransoris]
MTKTATMLKAAVLGAGLLITGLTAARADEVGDGIAKAGELYAAGDLAGALRELGFATTGIQGRLNESYGATLPEPPAGWTADAVDAQNAAVMGLGQSLTRTYTDPNGNTVKLSLAVDSPLLQTMGMIFANPMLAAQAGYQRLRIGSEDAMLQDDKAGNISIMLSIGGRMLLTAETGSVPLDQVKALFGAWKIAELKKLAGI